MHFRYVLHALELYVSICFVYLIHFFNRLSQPNIWYKY